MKEKHKCIGDVRNIGLFGTLELVKNRKTKEPLAPFNGSHPVVPKMLAYLKEKGVTTYINGHLFMTNPPLIITKEQIHETFVHIDKALELADKECD